MTYELPVRYDKLRPYQRREVREQYIKIQNGFCMYCSRPLNDPPAMSVRNQKINWKLFPENFLNHPVHLQHCHKTGMTEGAVHAYCNAVLWQYEGR